MSQQSHNDKMNSLKDFKRYRDPLLHEDIGQLPHHLKAFARFLERDPLIQSILSSWLAESSFSSEDWWADQTGDSSRLYRRGSSTWEFPEDSNDRLAVQLHLILDQALDDDYMRKGFIGHQHWRQGFSNFEEAQSLFISLIARPFCETLGDRLEEAIGMPSQEARDLQAVPLSRIPAENETRIFLSHKSEDKELVRRYYKVLVELGYKPWLDDSDMTAGANVDRDLFAGIDESCAIVFFLTENFRDENFLSEEINYAKQRKRERKKRFSIITLRFSDNIVVPSLLKTYIWKPVQYELDGLYEIIRALPIELGPVRWKEGVVE